MVKPVGSAVRTVLVRNAKPDRDPHSGPGLDTVGSDYNLLLAKYLMRMWRNWQTRWLQVPVLVREWRFESSHPQITHTKAVRESLAALFLFYTIFRPGWVAHVL